MAGCRCIQRDRHRLWRVICVTSVEAEETRASGRGWYGESTTRDSHLPVTDIVGSTRLWQKSPEAMQQTYARHDTILHLVRATLGHDR